MRRALLGALLALCIVGPAGAQNTPSWNTSFTLSTTATYLALLNQGSGNVFGRTYLAIDNPNASINVACTFGGGVATVNTGG
jgi:hypothetical protein